MTSSRQVAVRVGGLHGTIVALTRREWYAAVLEAAREAECRCGHAAYQHRVTMLASSAKETCDEIWTGDIPHSCRCERLELSEAVSRQVSEWVVAWRVGEALAG